MGRNWWKIDERSLDRFCGITVDEREAGMGSCTTHYLSVRPESAERPSPAEMQIMCNGYSMGYEHDSKLKRATTVRHTLSRPSLK
jgi:hypothetical protein